MNTKTLPVALPRVARFESLGLGLFVHWGLYSLADRGEWTKDIHGWADADYSVLARRFDARDFDAAAWVGLATGAGYMTLTTRHHDGFSLYDTRGLSDFDAMHTPAGRDLVAEFVEACRAGGIVPILYHTTLDWHHPDYRDNFPRYREYLRRSVEILCTHYGPIGGLWFDGNWDKPDADWDLDGLYGTIRSLQPEALIINNTGLVAPGVLGHPEIDSVTFEQGMPKPIDRTGMAKYVAGEMCQTLNTHWGSASDDFRYRSPAELIETLCGCRKVGANYLLNLAPHGGGQFPLVQRGLLEPLGRWMSAFGDAVRRGRPASLGSGRDFVLAAEGGRRFVFLFDLKVKGNANVVLGGEGGNPRVFGDWPTAPGKVIRMDTGEAVRWSWDSESQTLTVLVPGLSYGTQPVVLVLEVLPSTR